MQKSMELMQNRNRRLNGIVAEQTRAIAKLYRVVVILLGEWDKLDQPGYRGAAEVARRIDKKKIKEAREIFKEIKL
jgi:hypothetical protein